MGVPFLRFWLAAVLLSVLSQSNAKAWQSIVPELTDIAKVAQHSAEKQLPIMLVFSAQWCEYCEVLDERIFTPMVLNGLYDDKVVILRHVGVDVDKPITLWDGRSLRKSQWAYELDADLTPTVLFINASGKEIAPRIVGIQDLTLYATRIHQNLNIAYKNMGLDKTIPATPRALELQQQATP